jgi:hypothetical protein
MIQVLSGLGYGVIAFAILIAIGIVVLGTFGSTVASCPTGYTYNANATGYVMGTNTCCNSTASACTGGNATTASTATQQLNTINGYLGTGSGGLASFVPLVIIIVIGLLFLGMFMNKKGQKY